MRAQTTVALQPSWVGARVVYVVDRAGLAPIIFGVVRPPGSVMARPDATPTTVSVTAESDRLHLSASREVVLECGQASITLTRAGKVVIKGAYVLSRSSGYNKIKGAVVDIN